MTIKFLVTLRRSNRNYVRIIHLVIYPIGVKDYDDYVLVALTAVSGVIYKDAAL